jgi:hypothetical protein
VRAVQRVNAKKRNSTRCIVRVVENRTGRIKSSSSKQQHQCRYQCTSKFMYSQPSNQGTPPRELDRADSDAVGDIAECEMCTSLACKPSVREAVRVGDMLFGDTTSSFSLDSSL